MNGRPFLWSTTASTWRQLFEFEKCRRPAYLYSREDIWWPTTQEQCVKEPRTLFMIVLKKTHHFLMNRHQMSIISANFIALSNMAIKLQPTIAIASGRLQMQPFYDLIDPFIWLLSRTCSKIDSDPSWCTIGSPLAFVYSSEKSCDRWLECVSCLCLTVEISIGWFNCRPLD